MTPVVRKDETKVKIEVVEFWSCSGLDIGKIMFATFDIKIIYHLFI